MAVQVLVAMLAAWLLYVLWYIFKLFQIDKEHGLKLVVLVRNQEGAAEGFLRRLIVSCSRHWPGLRLVVVDDGSVDDTAGIIRLLGCDLIASDRIKCLPVRPGAAMLDGELVWCYDARGQQGKELLNSPLFSLLSLC